uniref:Uncharacterized protein n=1 Tax=Heterorhabditis bacteriophora TaxID=37862 RepID=A0A1I7X1E3_HETBA
MINPIVFIFDYNINNVLVRNFSCYKFMSVSSYLILYNLHFIYTIHRKHMVHVEKEKEKEN